MQKQALDIIVQSLLFCMPAVSGIRFAAYTVATVHPKGRDVRWLSNAKTSVGLLMRSMSLI